MGPLSDAFAATRNEGIFTCKFLLANSLTSFPRPFVLPRTSILGRRWFSSRFSRAIMNRPGFFSETVPQRTNLLPSRFETECHQAMIYRVANVKARLGEYFMREGEKGGGNRCESIRTKLENRLGYKSRYPVYNYSVFGLFLIIPSYFYIEKSRISFGINF